MKCGIVFPKTWNGKLPQEGCGCQNRAKVNGKYLYGGLYRIENIMYKTMWLPATQHYIDKTQDDLKNELTYDHTCAVTSNCAVSACLRKR